MENGWAGESSPTSSPKHAEGAFRRSRRCNIMSEIEWRNGHRADIVNQSKMTRCRNRAASQKDCDSVAEPRAEVFFKPFEGRDVKN